MNYFSFVCFLFYCSLYFLALLFIRSSFFRELAKKTFPKLIYAQRFLYASIFIIGFFYLKFFSEEFDLVVYDLSYPFDVISWSARSLLAALFIITLFKIDFLSFLGLRQLTFLFGKKKKINRKYSYSFYDELSFVRRLIFVLILILSPIKFIGDLFFEFFFIMYVLILYFFKQNFRPFCIN
jgi:hypothetical protein